MTSVGSRVLRFRERLSEGSRRDPADRRVRRAPLVVALAVIALSSVVAGDPELPPPPVVPSATDAVSMPPAGARSSAWYCPGGPESEAVGVKEVVTATNLMDREAVVEVTLFPGGRAASEEFTIAAYGTLHLVPADMSDAPHPAVIVEPFSSEVVVEQTLIVDGDLEVGPCATQPSDRWYFSNGTTLRGTEQWLVLFNPFGDDAIVDVTFFTDDGRKAPLDLGGLEVPRRSRVAVKVHESVRRQAFVATYVDARVGRVIAQQSEIFLPDSGRRGVAATLGAVAPSEEWWFADGVRRRGQARSIGIANPGGFDTEVDVQVVADGDAVIEPVTISVPRDSAVQMVLGACGENDLPSCVRVPIGLTFSILVSSATGVPFFAQSSETLTDEEESTGATTLLGSREPADRWVFARSSVQNADGASLAVLNPGGDAVSVDLVIIAPGGRVEPDEVKSLEIAPGERLVVDLLELLEAAGLDGGDAGVIVTSSAPVVAERLVTRALAVTRSIGVPDRG